MNQFSKWKTIGYAAAIFVTGGISGGALGVYQAKSTIPDSPGQRDIVVRIRDHLKEKLGLSHDEVQKIDPIIESAAIDLHSLRIDTARRANKIFNDAYTQVSAILTPDQRVKLDQMQRERNERMKRSMLMWQQRWQDRHPGAGNPQASSSP